MFKGNQELRARGRELGDKVRPGHEVFVEIKGMLEFALYEPENVRRI